MAKYINQTHHQNVRYDPSSFKKATQSPATNLRRRSVVSSTPLPGKYVPENIKLYFDQGTQTESEWMQPPISKIEEIELVLKHLYGRFQSLVMRVNNGAVTNDSLIMSESEQNAEVSYIEPSESWVDPNNIAENAVPSYDAEESNIPGDVGAEQIVENENQSISNPVKMEAINKKSNDSTRVRRMSAQTTYSNEMVGV